ncbi:MAG: AAA family ATPase [Bryobacteraceae bacterium]|nr:AAA family ATPase [Bryobacteraceae bacterium]
MIVSHLVLKNWRNFRTASVPLSERVFVIGPNASGKSNLLDVFRFLRDIAKPGGGLQRAISERGGLSKIRCLAARREPDVEIQVQLLDTGGAEWEYQIGITQQARGYRQPLIRYEKVIRDGKTVLDRPDKDDAQDELRRTQTHLEQISANAGFRDIARFFESFRYLHLVPQLLRYPQTYQGPGTPEDPFGRNFLETIAKTTEKTRRSRLRRIEAALRKAVPQLKNLTDTKDESGVPHLEVLYEHWRPHGARQREDQFSDGTLRLIGLFWSLLEGDAPLLLEEPELSLNAEIVRKLPALFHQIQRRRHRQVLVSTHSWDLLSDKGIGADEVVIITPDLEGAKVELGSDRDDIRLPLEQGLSVADAALPLTRPAGLEQLELPLE